MPSSPPTPDTIRTARGTLTQQQASALARVSLSAWQSAEQGRRRLDPAAWELFLLLTDQHPKLRVTKRRAGQKCGTTPPPTAGG